MTKKEERNGNNLISKKEFTNLANFHDQHCVSIYIPTHRAGEEVDQQKGQIRLKNCIKKIKNRLKEYNLKVQEIDNYLHPVENLLDDTQFWRNQSDGLVIFLSKQKMSYYTLPIHYEELVYVSDHFYLLPLIPLFNGDGKFYILSLSLQDVKLYECTRHSITRIFIEDVVPKMLEEVVGSDFQNKSLQFRTGQGGESGAIFHGQGSGKDDKDVEIEKFMRAVDSGLMSIVKNEKAPLVLASVDHYHPIYKRITTYPNFNEQHIGGNHEETDPLDLHEMAWPLVEDHFQQNKLKSINLIREHSASGRTSFDLNEIIPGCIDGRMSVLFIRNLTDKYGLYDKVNRSLIIDENIRMSQTSLYNLAALHTWLKGGHVYLVDKDEMPLKGTTINGLFRY